MLIRNANNVNPDLAGQYDANNFACFFSEME